MIKKFLHWLSHKTGNNFGHVVTWEENGFFYVGFECDGCKKIEPASIDRIESEAVLGKPIVFDEEK